MPKFTDQGTDVSGTQSVPVRSGVKTYAVSVKGTVGTVTVNYTRPIDPATAITPSEGTPLIDLTAPHDVILEGDIAGFELVPSDGSPFSYRIVEA